MKQAKTVDHYIDAHPEWTDALRKLRKILTATNLGETIKWGAPCYTLDGKNVVGVVAFKDYVGLWFHQGVFLSDPDQVLINAQEGKTKALRQWRFTNEREIKVQKVKAYVQEAIRNQEQGKGLKAERDKAFDVPAELSTALKEAPKAAKAFAALSKGKQREYAEHIASAKQAKTKVARIEKILPMIEAGSGLHDRYRC